jgi:23S rRNA (cytosine1962-C5)-methyltransferase
MNRNRIRESEMRIDMWIANEWKDYEVIDTSNGEKLERWGDYQLVRPDPQVIWDTKRSLSGWKKPNARYHRSSKGGGEWEFINLPKQWSIQYKELTFQLKPFSFKHTGLFPEQAVNWDWFSKKIREANRPVKVLNLFAYTGGATLAAAAAGASVTHVDASKGMVTWAKENAKSSGLEDAPIRWLVDDCMKFVEREIRRGNHYDGIIMDPPSYGRGPKGEIWKIEDAVYPLVQNCAKLLSKEPLFFLINSYTTGLAPSVLTYMLGLEVEKKFGGHVESQEIGLPVTNTGLILPCGASGRWEK